MSTVVNGYEIKPYANLRDGANLSGANLREADLREAYLRGADLRGADLRGADLCGANLREVDLRGANLRGADLREVDISEADLRGANLRGANLRGANLRSCIGNMKEVKSAQFDTWVCVWYTDPERGLILNIGCQSHPFEKWKDADPRWIAAMDESATEWWAKYGQILIQLVEVSITKDATNAQ